MKKILVALIALSFFSPIVMADETAGTAEGAIVDNSVSAKRVKKNKKPKMLVKQGNKNAKTDAADRDALKNPQELSNENKASENATH